jgi:glycerophosphoryl diester phosphodiesterase
MPRPLSVAHRGGAGLAPENTLAAFQLALQYQVDAVELDLHMSQDGALVVMHDADLKHATGTAGVISAFTLAELQQFDAAATYRRKHRTMEPQCIPTLQDVLGLVHGRTDVQIEIKLDAKKRRYPDIEAKVVDAVRRYDMIDEAVIISFDFPTLHTITALEPRLATGALISALPGSHRERHATRAAAALAGQGFRYVGAKYTGMTAAFAQALRAHDLRPGVWTVNDAANMRKFAEMGVAFITSDRPDLLQTLISASD